MDINGKLLEVMAPVQISESFRKREFVVEHVPRNPQYPEFLKFELTQDRCDQIDGFQPGQNVVVHFDLRGRKWTSPSGEVKYFVSLNAWRIEDGQAAATPGAPGEMPPPPAMPAAQETEISDDNLPF
ncbi:MAG TPA: hypothetical protein DCR55_12680 [Lentisphaeria bacterium]|jgi:hypothetical protein|nr:hypothetical protein [Lentisphaeria bacterium]